VEVGDVITPIKVVIDVDLREMSEAGGDASVATGADLPIALYGVHAAVQML
jgi:hypothetical protein